MIVAAWKNHTGYDPTGNGYGLIVSKADRDQYFLKEHQFALIELEGEHAIIQVNTNKKTFWGDSCRELISKSIGVWLIQNHLAPWEKQHPPKLNLMPLGGNRFKLCQPDKPD